MESQPAAFSANYGEYTEKQCSTSGETICVGYHQAGIEDPRRGGGRLGTFGRSANEVCRLVTVATSLEVS